MLCMWLARTLLLIATCKCTALDAVAQNGQKLKTSLPEIELEMAPSASMELKYPVATGLSRIGTFIESQTEIDTLCISAAESGNWEEVHACIASGAQPNNALCPAKIAIKERYASVLQKNRSAFNANYILCLAAQIGNMTAVRYLLSVKDKIKATIEGIASVPRLLVAAGSPGDALWIFSQMDLTDFDFAYIVRSVAMDILASGDGVVFDFQRLLARRGISSGKLFKMLAKVPELYSYPQATLDEDPDAAMHRLYPKVPIKDISALLDTSSRADYNKHIAVAAIAGQWGAVNTIVMSHLPMSRKELQLSDVDKRGAFKTKSAVMQGTGSDIAFIVAALTNELEVVRFLLHHDKEIELESTEMIRRLTLHLRRPDQCSMELFLIGMLPKEARIPILVAAIHGAICSGWFALVAVAHEMLHDAGSQEYDDCIVVDVVRNWIKTPNVAINAVRELDVSAMDQHRGIQMAYNDYVQREDHVGRTALSQLIDNP